MTVQRHPPARGAKDVGERALLKRVVTGDRGAFSDLYRQYHARLYGYLYRTLPSAAMVEEALDDVMYVVWKDGGKFRGRSSVSTWIFGIAYRIALGAMRKERRYQARLDWSKDTDILAGGDEPPDNLLATAFAHLSSDHRQVVELTYFGGFSYREIAEIAGCPVNTIKTRMYHAKRRLKVLIPELATPTREKNRGRA